MTHAIQRTIEEILAAAGAEGLYLTNLHQRRTYLFDPKMTVTPTGEWTACFGGHRQNYGPSTIVHGDSPVEALESALIAARVKIADPRKTLPAKGGVPDFLHKSAPADAEPDPFS